MGLTHLAVNATIAPTQLQISNFKRALLYKEENQRCWTGVYIYGCSDASSLADKGIIIKLNRSSADCILGKIRVYTFFIISRRSDGTARKNSPRNIPILTEGIFRFQPLRGVCFCRWDVSVYIRVSSEYFSPNYGKNCHSRLIVIIRRCACPKVNPTATTLSPFSLVRTVFLWLNTGQGYNKMIMMLCTIDGLILR